MHERENVILVIQRFQSDVVGVASGRRSGKGTESAIQERKIDAILGDLGLDRQTGWVIEVISPLGRAVRIVFLVGGVPLALAPAPPGSQWQPPITATTTHRLSRRHRYNTLAMKCSGGPAVQRLPAVSRVGRVRILLRKKGRRCWPFLVVFV